MFTPVRITKTGKRNICGLRPVMETGLTGHITMMGIALSDSSMNTCRSIMTQCIRAITQLVLLNLCMTMRPAHKAGAQLPIVCLQLGAADAIERYLTTNNLMTLGMSFLMIYIVMMTSTCTVNSNTPRLKFQRTLLFSMICQHNIRSPVIRSLSCRILLTPCM